MSNIAKKSNMPDPDKFKEFMSLINNEPNFPETLNQVLLERYLKINLNNVENSFRLLKHNLQMRQKTPYLFENRDIDSSEIQTACTTFQFVPLPKLTKDNHKVTVIRFPKCDASIYDSVQVIKTALMMFDANYTFYDNDDGFVDGEIFVLDVEGYSLKQFLDLSKNVKTFLFYTKFLQEGPPVSLVCNHVVNTSAVFDGVTAMVKPILSKRVSDLLQVHRNGKGLLSFIDKDVLPIDYGGTEKSIDELYSQWLAKFKTKREYLLNDDNWKLTDCSTVYSTDF
ncbi:Alpha-tocopherol transfer protein [Pseudolycoriella hygida]|uniref:Alpha-tocopherol transfer protein n=1 Tax=Pseudolycoriella hygida TaxID=35572 RepID=A0A9Q0N8Z7_9DIPT|nr:Alpha-tocopherol transfer protein [Pseudolycoriella hygida]